MGIWYFIVAFLVYLLLFTLIRKKRLSKWFYDWYDDYDPEDIELWFFFFIVGIISLAWPALPLVFVIYWVSKWIYTLLNKIIKEKEGTNF